MATARKISAFRVFHTRLREAFSEYRSPFVSIDVLLTWGATRFTSVAVRHDPRKLGVSNYTFMKLLTHAFNMMTGFTVIPLQVASFLGFGCGICLCPFTKSFTRNCRNPLLGYQTNQ
jgi:undecaprenyl-phosphate 4-deoxy-4-formamido-L-arabinose transferase